MRLSRNRNFSWHQLEKGSDFKDYRGIRGSGSLVKGEELAGRIERVGGVVVAASHANRTSFRGDA